jgi:hypothetical protein
MSILAVLTGMLFLFILAGLAIRTAYAQPRECLTCGRAVPEQERLVDRPDLRICEACVERGIAELAALERGAPAAAAGAAQCNFCGRGAAAGGPIVRFPQSNICRDCLHACQGSFQAEPAWLRPEAERQLARDNAVHFVFWLLGIGAYAALWWHSCTAQ